MQKIQLTQEQVALVDDRDYGWLNQWKWCAMWDSKRSVFRAVRKRGGRLVLMSREICGLGKDDKQVGDHRNHDTLDNQRHNLRVCTQQQNTYNRKKGLHCNRKCSSVFVGVYWHKNNKRWVSRIKHNGTDIHIGSFDSEIEAAKARDIKAKELFGDFACLNFPSPQEVSA